MNHLQKGIYQLVNIVINIQGDKYHELMKMIHKKVQQGKT